MKIPFLFFLVFSFFTTASLAAVSIDDTPIVIRPPSSCDLKSINVTCQFVPSFDPGTPTNCVHYLLTPFQRCTCECFGGSLCHAVTDDTERADCPRIPGACLAWDRATGQAGCEALKVAHTDCASEKPDFPTNCQGNQPYSCHMDKWTVDCVFDATNPNKCVYPRHEAGKDEAACKCDCTRDKKCVSRHYGGEPCGKMMPCPGFDPARHTETDCVLLSVPNVPLCYGECPIPPPTTTTTTTTMTATTSVNWSTTGGVTPTGTTGGHGPDHYGG